MKSTNYSFVVARDRNPFAAELGEGPERGLQHVFTHVWQRQQRQLLDARLAAEGGRDDAVWGQDACGYAAGDWQYPTVWSSGTFFMQKVEGSIPGNRNQKNRTRLNPSKRSSRKAKY